MKRTLFKARLMWYVLRHNLLKLLSCRISVRRFLYVLKKQVIISSLFKDTKYSKVASKYFIDPFAPYFPGPRYDKMLDNNSVDQYPLKPNHAQISITNICPNNCFHCHVKNTQDIHKDLPKEKIFETIDDIIKSDFTVMFFVGGEPLCRFDDLTEFIRYTRDHMDTRIFTSGVGADNRRLKILKMAGLEGICISLDHYDERIHNQQRKNNIAFKSACEAIKESSALGIYNSVVCCTTSGMVNSGDIFKMVDFAESLGAHSIQINEIRPVGRAKESGDKTIFLTKEDKQLLIDYYKIQNRSKRKIAIVMPWYNEEPYNFGCMATSGQNVYIDAQGNVQPCVLLKTAIGNIMQQRFRTIWNEFIPYCRHPVRECLVHVLSDAINNSPFLPLPKYRTFALWQEVTKMEPIDIFKRMGIRQREATYKAE